MYAPLECVGRGTWGSMKAANGEEKGARRRRGGATATRHECRCHHPPPLDHVKEVGWGKWRWSADDLFLHFLVCIPLRVFSAHNTKRPQSTINSLLGFVTRGKSRMAWRCSGRTNEEVGPCTTCSSFSSSSSQAEGIGQDLERCLHSHSSHWARD